MGMLHNRTNNKTMSVTMSMRGPVLCCFLFCSAGSLACSRVARVSVSPQALLALREQSRAFVCETGNTSQGKTRWQGPESDHDAPEKRQASSKVRP